MALPNQTETDRRPFSEWPRARVAALHTGASAVHFANASEIFWPLWALIMLIGLWRYCWFITSYDPAERRLEWRFACSTAFLVAAITVGLITQFGR